MNRRQSIIVTIFSIAIVIAVIAARIGRREDAAAEKKKVAEVSTERVGKTMENAVAVDATMTLEQWQQKISETGISEFRALLDAAMRITDPGIRNTVVIGIVDRWLREDPSNFTKYVAVLEVNADDAKVSVLVLALQDSLTKLSPEQAASDEILVVVQRLIAHFAVHNPDLALAWAKKWLLDDTMENALASVARGYAKTDGHFQKP